MTPLDPRQSSSGVVAVDDTINGLASLLLEAQTEARTLRAIIEAKTPQDVRRVALRMVDSGKEQRRRAVSRAEHATRKADALRWLYREKIGRGPSTADYRRALRVLGGEEGVDV